MKLRDKMLEAYDESMKDVAYYNVVNDDLLEAMDSIARAVLDHFIARAKYQESKYVMEWLKTERKKL